MDAVLCKNLEELEARIEGILVDNPANISSLDLLVFQIHRRAEFIRNLLAAETGTNSRQNLDQIAERLSVVETRFVNWVASGGDTESNSKQDKMVAENQEEIAERLSFIESNFSYLNNNATTSTTESKEDKDDQEEEEGKEIVSGVILSEADIERIALEVVERANKKRQDERLKMIRAMGVVTALAAATGFVISGFGSVEQSVYLVPT